MRWWHVILGGLTLTACGSDYDGESFPRVAEQDDIEVVSTVPEGARIIGTVSDLDSAETDGGFTEYALWCNVEDRLIRQMKRTAAREGGEYLVNVVCETFETAITWDRFEQFHSGIIEAVNKALADICGGGQVTCRFTHVYPDGPAPYFSIIAPARAGAQLHKLHVIDIAIDDVPHALFFDLTHRGSQLLSAITTKRSENIPCQALRMHTD